MAKSPSRRSLGSGNFDSVFESRGLVDRKVTKKIKQAREESQVTKIQRLTEQQLVAGRAKGALAASERPLSEKQAKYVEAIVDKGMGKKQALAEAGMSTTPGNNWNMNNNQKVQNAIAERRQAYEKAVDMSRTRVMNGLLEAVDMAKMKADPLSMVAGWREIAKICGYYEPTKVQVEVSVNGKMLLHQMQNMSDEDLLKLADQGNMIEGEFEDVTGMPEDDDPA